MFRRIEDTLEPDPSFPADLKKIKPGYFVNDLGQIRMINAPDKQYVFHSTNNDRVNEVLREAMQTCQRRETEKRSSYLGLNCIHLPKFAMDKPNGPHVPILAPSPEILKTRKRVIVLVNDAIQDLGILAYRQLQRELGINGGSVINFVKEIIKRSAIDNTAEKDDEIFKDGFKLEDNSTTPALIVLNTGQLLYSHKYDQAMTLRSWSALPRKSITHNMIRIHEEENRVKGHRNPQEHVKTVFDEVVCNSERVAADAEVYVIAIEDGTESMLNVLANDFDKYGSRITAMALIHSLIDDSQIKSPQLRAFLHQRTRQWRYTDLTTNPLHCTDLPEDYEHTPPDTSAIMKSASHIVWHEDLPKDGPLATISKAMQRIKIAVTPALKEDSIQEGEEVTEWASGTAPPCPTFAGGDNSVGECIFTNPSVQNAILSFFEDVAQDPEHYRNPSMNVYTKAPQASPDNPLALSADETETETFTPLAPEMNPTQAELDAAREKLIDLRIALSACPANNASLAPGRENVARKIRNVEFKIEKLEKDALGKGGLKAEEAQDKRRDENWKPQMGGLKVPFAGTYVDSELLKAAGLVDTAERAAVESEDREGDEEKAFV